MYDTAGSAKYISERKDQSLAAIATQRAGRDYGLKVVKEISKMTYVAMH